MRAAIFLSSPPEISCSLGGAGQMAYAQIGHGGAQSNSSVSGYNVSGAVTASGKLVTLAAGASTGSYAQIGHGGYLSGQSLVGGSALLGRGHQCHRAQRRHADGQRRGRLCADRPWRRSGQFGRGQRHRRHDLRQHHGQRHVQDPQQPHRSGHHSGGIGCGLLCAGRQWRQRREQTRKRRHGKFLDHRQYPDRRSHPDRQQHRRQWLCASGQWRCLQARHRQCQRRHLDRKRFHRVRDQRNRAQFQFARRQQYGFRHGERARLLPDRHTPAAPAAPPHHSGGFRRRHRHGRAEADRDNRPPTSRCRSPRRYSIRRAFRAAMAAARAPRPVPSNSLRTMVRKEKAPKRNTLPTRFRIRWASLSMENIRPSRAKCCFPACSRRWARRASAPAMACRPPDVDYSSWGNEALWQW